ncbi:helix-turn-helix domain-containing protein [Frankia sp. AiPs1]|uniref:helix-turn-helix domain-containing protein n=1 Tax=Frankia sp. AiPs1 TaxID=573493 RepID=UPI002043FB3F|nr:helix-turn-helix transcriptional regulator [Frankia sp. AiPs1]MCM3920614.1 helix-turn-helix domain-containing protein [Frankia sp. AiPs1]
MTTPEHTPSCAIDPKLHPLAQLRAAHGWSYQQLARLIAAHARRAGINMAAERQKIWRWEHRGVTPDRFTQGLLAELLGLDPQVIVTHRWPAWLPGPQQPACQQEIAELRRHLAEAEEQIAALSRPSTQRVMCRTAGPRGRR